MILMSVAAAVKLLYSASAPASFDLQNMTGMLNPTFPNSPWIILEQQLFILWKLLTASTLTDPTKWWLTPPSKMPPDLLLLSLLFRLPVLLADVSVSIALYLVTMKVTRSAELSRLSSLVWFLNPYTLFAAELLGAPDVAVALLTVLTLLFLNYKRILLASLSLATAIGLKLYPLLLVPVIVLYVREVKMRWSCTLLIILSNIIGTIGYLSWLYPYTVAIFSLDYTPVSQPLNLFTISFAPGQTGLISVTLLVLVIVYLSLWNFVHVAELSLTIIMTLFAYYLFSSPYPQYFIWVVPYLTLDVVYIRRERAILLTSMMVFLFSIWFIISHGFAAPSGYSLLYPIIGNSVSTEQFVDFTSSAITTTLLLPLLNAGLYATILIYTLDITVRDCLGLGRK
jgi:hypothetical protein